MERILGVQCVQGLNGYKRCGRGRCWGFSLRSYCELAYALLVMVIKVITSNKGAAAAAAEGDSRSA